MRRLLNRHIPFDAIARWWYLMVAGPAMGLVFSLATGIMPLSPGTKLVIFVEGPPSQLELAYVADAVTHGWKENFLFTVLGYLAVCGVIWLLEELRAYKQHIREPRDLRSGGS